MFTPKCNIFPVKNILALSIFMFSGCAFASWDENRWGSDRSKYNCSKTWDTFKNGFTVTQAPDGNTDAARWFYFAAGPFVGDDGVATVKGKKLTVVPKGTSASGQPAFTRYLAPEGVDNNPYGLPGGLDHVKWLVYMNNIASTGYPGFTAPDKGNVRCEAMLQGQSFGTESHPFGGLVADADDDLRLGSAAINAIDFQTYMVFDVFVSNKRIYAFYERLPFGWGQPGFSPNYAAFSYAIPIADRKVGDMDKVKISYNKAKGTVTWYVNGKIGYRISKIGYRLDNQAPAAVFKNAYTEQNPAMMFLNHGGTEELVQPKQLNCGMGLFTLLDANYPGQQGLVKISTNMVYVNPSYPTDAFLFTTFDKNHYLWGQGAKITVLGYKVTSPDMCQKDPDDDGVIPLDYDED